MSDFDNAVQYVRSAPAMNSTTEDKLGFYKFFKQATEGDVQGSQPWAVQVEARAKYDAWASVKGTSTDDAKKQYVALLDKIVPAWRN